MISADQVDEMLEFDTATGEIWWRIRPNGRVPPRSKAGRANKQGYSVIQIKGKKYKAHRLIWLHAHREWPSGQIDHINGRRDDNRIENLREVDCSHNMRNTQLRSNNKTGVHGVYWNKASKKWQAQIRVQGKANHLGLFENFEDAVRARAAANKRHGFHPNHGRQANERFTARAAT